MTDVDARGLASVGRSFPPWSVPFVFVVGALAQYLGAAIGVHLFDTISPAAVAWLRAAGAAAVLLAWRRPWRTRWTARTIAVAGGFGVVTVGMNLAFYEAIARIPLGTAVAIEFLGPVLVAALGSRRARDVLALVLVVAGVALVAGARFDVGLVGVGFALLAAGLWAGYVVLGKSVATAGDGLDSLAVGMAVASVILAPLALTPQVLDDPSVFTAPSTWLLGVGVGVLSSVIPYALDQVVLRTVGRARFALLLALLPTTATVVGVVVLRQVPSIAELAGILCVIVAVALGGVERRARPAPPADTTRLQDPTREDGR
ncbi:MULTISPECIES: DMT family transporter [unclassified Rhodococcus (in: high G+C Gram-positive bacteria)]|jgi:inner membrane transporter RhtA|uniref:EamA family transporter n=1 Tax=unclassified Rhodococcus (in: high G+C Gram-positive bacteria) TaxID=192944 RepID=UPI0009E8D93C|nr:MULTISPECIES: EamA family transporter [unclassified Rhodococcus (in: high G+C Gram-positive bacteria)]MBY6705519.1 EamA family transporter [Rhodococcus sp. BP-241]MDQ1180217.1 inner membrane transporter RhtA [Rhodococcus sp. SORGH_AS_0301]MDQ1201545.1 inner membrane transporter RhtA [Rhodococcus sp. SORGH_AS_0303]